MPCVADQVSFWVVFGCLRSVLGPSKTWIPYDPSFKHGYLMEASSKRFGRACGCSQSLSWRPFSGPWANLTGVRASKLRFFSRLGRWWHNFSPSSHFWGAFRSVFGFIFGCLEANFCMFIVSPELLFLTSCRYACPIIRTKCATGRTVTGFRRIKRARSARAKILVYIYIYMFVY